MGNQGGSSIGVPKIQEWIDKDKIGKVHTIYAWTNRPVWPQGVEHPNANPSEKPKTLDWDLWLGTARKNLILLAYTPLTGEVFWNTELVH